MDFKRCLRCGAFFLSNSNVCPNCQCKDKVDIERVNNFINQNVPVNSIHELSANTGVSINNLNRFIADNEIKIQL